MLVFSLRQLFDFYWVRWLIRYTEILQIYELETKMLVNGSLYGNAMQGVPQIHYGPRDYFGSSDKSVLKRVSFMRPHTSFYKFHFKSIYASLYHAADG